MVKEFAAVRNTAQIVKLLNVLGRDFALSKNPNYKKGGLIGLAAIAVALGKVPAETHIQHYELLFINAKFTRCF